MAGPCAPAAPERQRLPRPAYSRRRRPRSGRPSAPMRRRSSGRRNCFARVQPFFGRLVGGLGPFVDFMAARAEMRENLITDRAGCRSEIVDRNTVADESRHVAAMDDAVG